jgi:hypothetical protein
MAAYMHALDRLSRRQDAIYWPTHAGPILDPHAHLAELIAHRLARRAAILAALSPSLSLTPAHLVQRVYTGLDPRLIPAAAESVRAHLIELAAMGLVQEGPEGWRRR